MMYPELSITQLRRQELHSRILLVCYQIMDHVILLPLSNSISVRNIISGISMENLASADAGKDRTISQIDEKCD